MVSAASDRTKKHAAPSVTATALPYTPTSSDSTQSRHSSAQDLTFFFSLAYLAHGVACAQFGLIAQPLQFFMMKGQHLSAAEASSYVALLMIPWVIKPVYGLMCDFLPLGGYRYKSYLLASNLVTAIAFCVLSMSSYMPVIVGALLVSAVAMAISTALMIALAVESGRKDGKARHYFGVQEIFYYGASICAAIAGGALCQNLPADQAFHTAAAIAVVPAVICSWLALFVLREEKTSLNISAIKETAGALLKAFKTRALWITGIFSFAWNFSPAFGVPLYFYQSNSLHFSQQEIGQLTACNSVGMLIAATAYKKFIKILPVKGQLLATCALVAVSTAGYLLLNSFESAMCLEFFRGIAGMMAILSVYGLAADVCPPRTEVSVMALLVAVRNLATNASTFVGGQLFTHVFHNEYTPLVLVAILTPALSTLLIPAVCSKKKDETSQPH